MYKCILVPLDGSALAEQALQHAAPLAQSCGAQLHLVRVVDPQRIPVPPDAVDFQFRERLRQDAAREAELYIKGQEANCKAQGLTVTAHAPSGAVAATIVELAGSLGCDLIVICTHGRSGLGRWMHGSVAEKVMRGASTSLLVVRPRP